MVKRKRGPAATADLTVGGDIEEGDQVDVVRMGGDVMLQPRAIRNATKPQQKALGALQSTVHALEHGQQQLERQVAECRERGLSWDTIGWCCGITGEAVRKRFSDD